MVRSIVGDNDTATVLTASPPPYPEDVGIRTLRVKRLDYRSFFGSDQQGGAVRESVKRNQLAQWLVRLVNTFPINILVGEGGLLYLWQLIRKGSRCIREDQVTHLYSSFRPMTDHLAAWYLKRRYPALCWIADFRDLPVDPHYRHVLFPGWHRRLYARLFSKADILTTVSEGLAAMLQEDHPQVVVTRNGLPGGHSIPGTVVCPKFTIVYTGSLFLGYRDPSPMFEEVAKLVREGQLHNDAIRLVYAGKDGDGWMRLAARHGLETIAEDRGLVPPDEARQLQREACINLLLTVSSSQLTGVLTGKLIEYAAAGGPVLAISQGQRDPEIGSLLESSGLGTCVSDRPEDRADLRAFILREYDLWRATGQNRRPASTDAVMSVFGQDAILAPLRKLLAFRA